MTIYNQRDSKWASDLMGTGNIGNYGCLITCLSMLRGIDPKQTNKDIKAVGGYDGNYVIWEKLDQVDGLDFIKRVRQYDNADVSNNLPCLVEVNGAPIGGTTHWVLYVGNHMCYDPWTGTEKITSTYEPIGYAVVKAVPAPVTSPVFTDQTKISKELLGTDEDMEIQQIRGKLNDLRLAQSVNDSLRLTVAALNQRTSELEQLLDNIASVVFGRGWIWVKLSNIKKLLG